MNESWGEIFFNSLSGLDNHKGTYKGEDWRMESGVKE